jgi:hypothetical protein
MDARKREKSIIQICLRCRIGDETITSQNKNRVGIDLQSVLSRMSIRLLFYAVVSSVTLSNVNVYLSEYTI